MIRRSLFLVLSNGELRRLKKIDKTLLNRIFSVENQAFVAFILKLTDSVYNRKKRYFATTIKKNDDFSYFYTSAQILDPLDKDIVGSFKNNNMMYYFVNRIDYEEDVCNDDEFILKNLRVTQVRQVYDTIVLSSDVLEKTDELIDLMLKISNKAFFTNKIENYPSDGVYKELPAWFDVSHSNTISSWLVSHFEVNLQLQ